MDTETQIAALTSERRLRLLSLSTGGTFSPDLVHHMISLLTDEEARLLVELMEYGAERPEELKYMPTRYWVGHELPDIARNFLAAWRRTMAELFRAEQIAIKAVYGKELKTSDY